VGLGWVDFTVLLEECGRSLFPSPLVATTLAALAIRENGSVEQQAEWLPGIADGRHIVSVAILEASDLFEPGGIALAGEAAPDGVVLSGEKFFVSDVAAATHFIVVYRSGPGDADISLALVERDAEGLEIEATPCIDATKRIGRLSLDGVRVANDRLLASAAKPGWPAIERLLDQAAAATTAEAIGAAEGGHSLMVEYAKQRMQFGSLIGRFQGVKHPRRPTRVTPLPG